MTTMFDEAVRRRALEEMVTAVVEDARTLGSAISEAVADGNVEEVRASADAWHARAVARLAEVPKPEKPQKLSGSEKNVEKGKSVTTETSSVEVAKNLAVQEFPEAATPEQALVKFLRTRPGQNIKTAIRMNAPEAEITKAASSEPPKTSALEELETRAAEIVAQHPKLSFAQALKRARKAHPDLVRKHQRESGRA